ncbi:pilus assembly protein Flp/PilA [Burkholderia multivorans]
MVSTFFSEALNGLFELIASVRDARCMSDERGVTAIEYGLIASLIAVAIIGGAYVVGTDLNSVFTSISTDL